MHVLRKKQEARADFSFIYIHLNIYSYIMFVLTRRFIIEIIIYYYYVVYKKLIFDSLL